MKANLIRPGLPLYLFYVLVGWACLTVACRPSNPEMDAIAVSREKLAQSPPASDAYKTNALNLARAYEAFSKKYVNHDSSAQYLLRAANLYAVGVGTPDLSLQTLEKVRLVYPAKPEGAVALFKMAEINHIDLHKPETALPLYREFAVRYPEHPYARVAQEAVLSIVAADSVLTKKIPTPNP